MRSLIALIAAASLLPGCCVIGMTAGEARARAHNDEVARKLERGEYVGPEDQKEQSPGKAAATGFVVGGLLDAAVVTLAYTMLVSSFSLGPTSKPSEYY